MSEAGDRRFTASATIKGMHTRLGLVVLACALALAASVSVSVAKSPALPPGVHVDPNSPAGKEYSIPLGQARGGGSSGGGPLFGSGVKPGPGGPSGPQNGSTGGGARAAGHAIGGAGVNASGRSANRLKAGRSSGQSSSAATAAADSPSVTSQVLGAGPQGTDGVVWMVGAAALVLALGTILAAALGRRSRRTPRMN